MPGTRPLSNISDEATTQTNTTGQLDPILEWSPNDGLRWVIQDRVEKGDQQVGIPIYADLRDSGNNQLPQDTRVALQYEKPTYDNRETVTDIKQNIRPYNDLTVSDQQNEEYVDQVKHILKGSALEIRQEDTLWVVIDSSTQIDWSNSRLTIDESAVREISRNL